MRVLLECSTTFDSFDMEVDMLLKNDELSVADCTFSYFFAFVIPLVFAFELVEGSCPPLLLLEAPCCIPLLEVKADLAPRD